MLQLLLEREQFSITRYHYTRTQLWHVHSHDFAEVWWINEGSAQQEINGVLTPVQQGDLMLMRPADVHGQ
jgi:AraC family cel operon transcriptional repressor